MIGMRGFITICSDESYDEVYDDVLSKRGFSQQVMSALPNRNAQLKQMKLTRYFSKYLHPMRPGKDFAREWKDLKDPRLLDSVFYCKLKLGARLLGRSETNLDQPTTAFN